MSALSLPLLTFPRRGGKSERCLEYFRANSSIHHPHLRFLGCGREGGGNEEGVGRRKNISEGGRRRNEKSTEIVVVSKSSEGGRGKGSKSETSPRCLEEKKSEGDVKI